MSAQSITSIKDERVVEARALSSAAGRRQAGKCLLEGAPIIRWALEAGVSIERSFYHRKGDIDPLVQTLLDRGIDCFAVSDGILKRISGTSYLIPIIGVGRCDSPAGGGQSGDFVLVLDDVRDLGNIGTIIRTACAFGIRDMAATSEEFDLYYRKTIEASRGKVFDIRLQHFSSASKAVSQLKARGYQVVATSPHAPALQSTVHLAPKPVALVVGNETAGVSDEALREADLLVQIPMSRAVESLNVGVATGISVYELKLKMVLTMLTRYIRTTLGRETNVAGKCIQQALDSRLEQVCPFDSTQMILLMIMKCDEVMTLEQVSKDANAWGEELQTLMHPLFDGGFVERVDDSSVRLTTRGEELLGQFWSVVEATEDDVLNDFSEEERRQLFDYLRRIQHNCETIISAATK